MSAATGLMYAIGQRDGVWGLEALDFETGNVKAPPDDAIPIPGRE